MSHANPYFNAKPYVPASLSEIYDLLGSMILFAPTFIDETSTFEDRNIDTEFLTLAAGFDMTRKKLGEERYEALVDLAVRAKALFAADPEGKNGKTAEGLKLLFEIEDRITEVRRRRVKAKDLDDDGEVTGD
ncbi:hypothetical protein [uncultured Sphingomonas sp.]|uniref:hypothetical protein n=1 Tax=uncultured Sphingomonas sp. TaxID=158754 RepID=UPI0035CB1A77